MDLELPGVVVGGPEVRCVQGDVVGDGRCIWIDREDWLCVLDQATKGLERVEIVLGRQMEADGRDVRVGMIGFMIKNAVPQADHMSQSLRVEVFGIFLKERVPGH